MNSHYWAQEREIKKSIQAFIKNFLEVSEDRNSQKVMELIRNHEKAVVAALAMVSLHQKCGTGKARPFAYAA